MVSLSLRMVPRTRFSHSSSLGNIRIPLGIISFFINSNCFKTALYKTSHLERMSTLPSIVHNAFLNISFPYLSRKSKNSSSVGNRILEKQYGACFLIYDRNLWYVLLHSEDFSKASFVSWNKFVAPLFISVNIQFLKCSIKPFLSFEIVPPAFRLITNLSSHRRNISWSKTFIPLRYKWSLIASSHPLSADSSCCNSLRGISQLPKSEPIFSFTLFIEFSLLFPFLFFCVLFAEFIGFFSEEMPISSEEMPISSEEISPNSSNWHTRLNWSQILL